MRPGSPSGRRNARLFGRVIGTRLFLISYMPLWAMFAVRSADIWGEVAFGTVAVLALADSVRLISAGLAKSARKVTVDGVSDKGGEVSGYLATYLLPFISGPPDSLRGWLAYGLYFLVAWSIFVSSDMGLINPTLYLLGWRVITAEWNQQSLILLCQQPPAPGATPKGSALPGAVGWVLAPEYGVWLKVARRYRS